MADIIGLIASIVNIIEVVIKASGFVKKHIHTDAAAARKELVPVLVNVTALTGFLQALKLKAEIEEREDVFLALLALVDGQLYACKDVVKTTWITAGPHVSVGKLNIGQVLDE